MKLIPHKEYRNNVVRMFSHSVDCLNWLTVDVGTNCPQGGDWGHGGRTVLRIINEHQTNIQVGVDRGPLKPVDQIEIVLGGDSEASTFLEGLEFAVRVLRDQLSRSEVGRDERFA